MKILVVVDMQNDFIDGTLGTKEAQAIVPNVIKKIKEYTNNNDQIILTQDTHYNENYLETLEGKKLPIKHCIQNTYGHQINEDILNAGIYRTIITKETFGTFDIARYYRDLFKASDSIELVGLCTDICVISNAIILKAAFPNTPIIVDSKCCAGSTPKAHEKALDLMKNSLQIEVI